MAGKIDDRLTAQKQLFWQMLVGTEPPDWHILQELHGIICMTEKALPQAVREERLTLLHNAWRCGLRATSPDWRYLEEIDRQIRAIEKSASA